MPEQKNKDDHREDHSPRLFAEGMTDPGKVRDHNEDAFSILRDFGLFILSDGMGGHQGGTFASRMVVETLPKEMAVRLADHSDIHEDLMENALRQAICELNRLIRQKASETQGLNQMGATIISCFIHNNVAAIAHMGDSRAYLMREACLEQLTEDHTVAEMLLHLGQITEKEALKHPTRHALTRHIGMEGDLGPETQLLELKVGDRLLLCSDGLTNEVKEQDIGEILWGESDIKTACGRLIRSAKQAGGKDNITVVIIQYDGSLGSCHRETKKVQVKEVIGRSLRKKDSSDLWL